MHVNAAFHISLLYGFLLVLARMAGIFIFLPLPGLQAGPDAAKITLAMALTFALYSRWPVVARRQTTSCDSTGWMLAEAGIGLATGLAVAFIIEGWSWPRRPSAPRPALHSHPRSIQTPKRIPRF